jgi:Mn-dependent DtxR family transcriptional regulator
MKALIDIVKQHGPISRAGIAKRLSISEREVQALIAEMNARGVPVVFTGGGFKYARNNSEKAHCIRTLKSAAYSMLKRAAGIEKRDLDIVAKELFT